MALSCSLSFCCLKRVKSNVKRQGSTLLPWKWNQWGAELFLNHNLTIHDKFWIYLNLKEEKYYFRRENKLYPITCNIAILHATHKKYFSSAILYGRFLVIQWEYYWQYFLSLSGFKFVSLFSLASPITNRSSCYSYCFACII